MGISANGIAILMSFLAGAATTIGGLIGLVLGHRIKPVPFAGALGFAGGVMVFVSFVEIYNEGWQYLEAGFYERNLTKHPDKTAACVAMALFFVGWLLASIIDACVHTVLDWHTSRAQRKGQLPPETRPETTDVCDDSETGSKPKRSLGSAVSQVTSISVTGVERPPKKQSIFKKIWYSKFFMALTGSEHVDLETQAFVDEKFARECYKITRLGYFTAFVLALHNFPEGIATFTGGAADRKLGLGLCIAIGIHNIPEGMAVAVPILFGTGSKWKAMLYTIVSGLAEPVGGFLAWGIIGGEPDPLAFGILFMITCGIMVNVALKELLFAAIKYDQGNRITSLSFAAGMVVMAVSLVCLEYAE
eukprot:Gregarina_sp_Pseudo_9__1193@NODE_1786_length_1332_cov_5_627224_g1655_i0_p1_GENE_NODE_1786_length_1332_cov_5_627224_g1655_i0NODE_1786_length_1332_cov_5_627224_g1655_i0_p1_ORF_typecomplete_len389_score70_10Zip/PF02535_22/0_00035Zip/PF02535_22/6_3e47ApoO/PF09769_9/1_2e02ApoO/PF09769_9/86_NODE_1786_length_1332_cov_5_627224_g1655_i0851167